MNRIKKYNEFVKENLDNSEYDEDERLLQDEPAITPYENDTPTSSTVDLDIEDEEGIDYLQDELGEDLVELVYAVDNDEWTINKEDLELPKDFVIFNDWFENISEDEINTSSTEDVEENTFTYRLSEDLYKEFLEIQEEENKEDNIEDVENEVNEE